MDLIVKVKLILNSFHKHMPFVRGFYLHGLGIQTSEYRSLQPQLCAAESRDLQHKPGQTTDHEFLCQPKAPGSPYSNPGLL